MCMIQKIPLSMRLCFVMEVLMEFVSIIVFGRNMVATSLLKERNI